MKIIHIIIFLILGINANSQSNINLDSIEQHLCGTYDDYIAELSEFKETYEVPDSLRINYDVSNNKLWRFTGPNKKSDSLITAFYTELEAVLNLKESFNFDFKKLKLKITIDSIDASINSFSFNMRLSTSSCIQETIFLQKKDNLGIKVYDLHNELQSDKIDLKNKCIKYKIQVINESNPKIYLLFGEYTSKVYSGTSATIGVEKKLVCAILLDTKIKLASVFDDKDMIFIEGRLPIENIDISYNKYKKELDINISELESGMWFPTHKGGIRLNWNGQQFITVANNVYKK